MRLLNIGQLPKDHILLGRRIKTEAGLFELLGQAVARGDPKLALRVQDALVRRHARSPVTLGGGFALPHASVSGLCAPRAVFVRSSTPVQMAAADGIGVTNVLALLVPFPGLTQDYDLLMTLTAFLTGAAGREALLRARSAADIQAIFSGEDQH